MIENAMTRLRKRLAAERWALLPLRLMIGFGFAAHGYAKLSRGPDGFAGILAAMGIPAPGPMAWLTSLLEFLGGISLMLGAAVAPLSVPLAAIMATAMFGVHFRYGFSSIRLKGISAEGAEFGPVGYEVNLLYIAGLVALALSSASPLSIDRWLEARRSRDPQKRAAS
jgi:putative oxidoreductase